MNILLPEKNVVWDLFVVKDLCIYWILHTCISAEVFLFGVTSMSAFPVIATGLNRGRCLSFSI